MQHRAFQAAPGGRGHPDLPAPAGSQPEGACSGPGRTEAKQKMVIINFEEPEPRKDELRELLAICQRYGVNMRQLAKFETATNRQWFRDPQKYWDRRCLVDLRQSHRITMRMGPKVGPDMGPAAFTDSPAAISQAWRGFNGVLIWVI